MEKSSLEKERKEKKEGKSLMGKGRAAQADARRAETIGWLFWNIWGFAAGCTCKKKERVASGCAVGIFSSQQENFPTPPPSLQFIYS